MSDIYAMLKEVDLFQLAQYVITKDTSDFPETSGFTILNTTASVFLSLCTSTFLLICIVLENIFNFEV